MPPFEARVLQGTKASIEKLDRCIYDTLLALKIPAENVTFNAVQTKRHHGEEWVYTNLEVHLKNTLPASKINAVFSELVSSVVPKASIYLKRATDQKMILDLSVNGHPTHRILFVSAKGKKPASPTPLTLPRVAIIIDDLGYDDEMALKFLKLDGILSFSVLPHSPFQNEIATAIHREGKDVLLHLPMEPEEYPGVDPGRGALLSSMGPDELLDQLHKDLNAVPFIVGVNNHMGSKLTQSSAKMRQIFTVLKKKNLFFVDSLTSPNSHCSQAAKLLQLKFAERQVFLDHSQDANTIRFQIKRLVTIARERGTAIGIGHPHPLTWKVLENELPRIKNEVNLVPVSELLG